MATRDTSGHKRIVHEGGESNGIVQGNDDLSNPGHGAGANTNRFKNEKYIPDMNADNEDFSRMSMNDPMPSAEEWDKKRHLERGDH
jgi:hypothetical protein